MTKKIVPAIVLIGVSSITVQIVLLREFLIFSSGNELSIGIILANWLFCTGIGSWFGGKISARVRQPVVLLAALEIMFSVVLTATIFSIRGIKYLIAFTPGEIVGIVPAWIFSLILLSGICFLNGFMFVIGCSAFEKLSEHENPAESIGRVYIFESLGAGVGGLICSLFLIQYFSALRIIYFIALANICVSGLLWKKARRIIFGIALVILVSGMPGIVSTIDLKSRGWQWKGYDLVASKDSVYGNISVIKQDSVYSFYESGLLAFSAPDMLSNEEAAHFALLQHPNPKNILLIGGGAGGVLDEILKYPSVLSIDYVELDPLLVALARNILPQDALNNPRVNVHNADGRKFIKTLPQVYDVIIVNLPDPNTAQINRFYTAEFFGDAARHLNKNGVLSIGATSSENYISPELGEYLRCIYSTLKKIFPEIIIIPGDYCRFIASREGLFITDNYNILEQRLNVNTRYVRNYYLKDKLNPEKLNYIHEQLTREKGRINTDFHPICYYYNITLWSTYFNNTFKKVFQFAAKIRFWHYLFLILIVLVLPKMQEKYRVLVPIMTSGFSEISFQIITIVAFQVIYGNLYYKLGIIFTSFMIGLALGSYWISRVLPSIKNDYQVFLKTQIAIIIYPLLLPVIFYLFARYEKLSFLGNNVVFPYLPVIAGFIGGFQYPLGNKIYLGGGSGTGRAAGVTYGIDLFGSCIGVLLISAFVLPVLGITQTCLVTTVVNLCALIIMLKR